MGELLGAAAWAGKIYSGGCGGGHTFASVEPATGRQLGLRRLSDALPGQHGLIGR